MPQDISAVPAANTANIVGAGLSGAVIARVLAEAGHKVTVFESRDHIGGNCHTERDAETGVMLHRYGPHIFHTDSEDVWQFATRFANFKRFHHKVRATSRGKVYPLPVTLATINQFFELALRPDEARAFVAGKADSTINAPRSFEEQAQSMIGNELYEAFFKGYTQKQWGRAPSELPASILKRLPLRFTYEDSYFNHKYQALPENGYTDWIAAILDHPDITVRLKQPFTNQQAQDGEHVFWSGPLDGYFGYSQGRLAYRSLRFENFTGEGDYQGCPVMNFCDADKPYTRVTEHKHFAPWESHDKTVYSVEYPFECGPEDTPYYPVRLVEDKSLLQHYVSQADQTKGVTFVGRLGTYRYLDMDVCIAEALQTAAQFLEAQSTQAPMPAFVHPPL
ncbi:UDP-galactopyranose mutase [Lentibacter algarum]|uniref:UDP-galactopyranose mutase n=1 Tax=Lentibacter algarum TaxID=576131 RepID=UPI001C07935A|nr:UDP-galactopyranose mutase [Lentibacter algarum]MBU2980670.1 UDP-galactopyranose mutase [Lentibacter algarum]